MLPPMADILDLICWAVIGVFRSRASLEAEILTLRDLVAWSLCKACLDVEAASIMPFERISRARVRSSG